MLEVIAMHPGISVRELSIKTGEDYGRIAQHLTVLRQEKMVTNRREGKNVHYELSGDFPSGYISQFIR